MRSTDARRRQGLAVGKRRVHHSEHIPDDTQCKPRYSHPPTHQRRPPGNPTRRLRGRGNRTGRTRVRRGVPTARGCTLLQLARTEIQLGRGDLLPCRLRIRAIVIRGEGHPVQIACCGQLNQPGLTCGEHTRRLVRRGRHHGCGIRLQPEVSLSQHLIPR